MNPLPGSPQAIALGCTCPVIDNYHGAGVPVGEDQRIWWYSEDCPLHGVRKDSAVQEACNG